MKSLRFTVGNGGAVEGVNGDACARLSALSVMKLTSLDYLAVR